MLHLDNVSIARQGQTLIEGAELALYPGEVMALIGANGSGKSSLFSAILGNMEVSEGEIGIKKNARVAALAQEVPALAMSGLEYVIGGHEELSAARQALAIAEENDDFDAQMHLHTTLHELDGYRAEAMAAKILIGLQFQHDELENSVASFSGGWRMRLNLARCLFAPSDIMLLDEPTNHLDMEAIFWLQEYIKRYQGAILLVSHDRDFMDETITRIAHLENQKVKLYTGNYSAFELERAQQLEVQRSQHKKQQAHISHMMSFVERFKAKASKAKQAQGRLKAIERMDKIEAVLERNPFTFAFEEPPKMPNPMLSLDKVDLGYGDTNIIKRIKFRLNAGQRLGLIGVNGAGKSTLIKALSGELEPQSGDIMRPAGIQIGYFAQHQVDKLSMDVSPFLMFRRLAPNVEERKINSYLGSFGFDHDKARRPINSYSGGEKARVALAEVVWSKPNLLLLDEPTNHLDLEVRQALMIALNNYTGALILVTHDRYLMRSLVDELYLIDNHALKAFDGTVEDYQKSIDTQ